MDMEAMQRHVQGCRDVWIAAHPCHRQQVKQDAPSCIDREAEVLAEYQRRTGRRRPINEAGLNRLCIGCRVMLSLSDAVADLGVMVIAQAANKRQGRREGPANG